VSITIGIIKNHKLKKYLQKFKNIKIVEFDNQNKQITALSFGRVNFIIQTIQTANVYIKKNYFANIYPIQQLDYIDAYEPLHFGIKKENKILQSIINKSLEQIDLENIKKEWFNIKLDTNKIKLTQKEQEFIKNHPTIYLGSEKAWEPYVIQNKNGTISGYDADILNKINSLTGANFQLKLGNWVQMQEKAKTKEIDGLSTGAIHDERKKYLNFSDVYITLQKMILVKHRNPKNIKTIKDLDSKKIVIHKGNLVDKKISKAFPNSTIIEVNTVEDMLKEVIYGDADATFGNGATEYLANKLGLPYLDFAFGLDHRLELAFGIRKDWPEAISIINKALQSIPEYEMMKIKQKWFFLNKSEEKIDRPKVTLSVDENLYIKYNPSVNLCIDNNWYPFEFKNKEGNHDGLIANLFETITSNIGLKTNLINTKNWQETLEYLQNKKCDLVASAQKTKDREKYLLFTSSYITTPLVVATKSNIKFIDDFNKISNKTFAIVKGYASINLLKNRYKNIKIIEVNSIKEGLDYVLDNKAFGFIDTVSTILHSINEHSCHDINIIGKVDLDWDLRIGTRSDKPILNSILQKGVNSLTKQEVALAKDKWLGKYYISKPDYSFYVKLVIGIMILALIVLYYNIILRKKIKEALIKHNKQEVLMSYKSKQENIGEILGNIAHQWRHPLSELSSSIMVMDTKRKLNQPIDNEFIDNYISKSNDIINFMSETIDTFNNFYKTDTNKTDFEISKTINETLVILQGAFETNCIKIKKDIEENIIINGNQNEFKQVLLSIIVNAKNNFVKQKSINPKIEISLLKKDKIYLKIQDNGGGINENIIDNIFECTVSDSKSSGAGLYITKNIIETKFNGNITAQNKNSGALFIIELDNTCLP
jgi:polar amino acid transport system substrate-binding protein